MHTRAQEALALLVVGIERHIAAMQSLVEQVKTRLTSITPTGRIIEQ